MKRPMYIVIIISFLLSGCGNDQYSLEKEFWKAEKKAEQIFLNPHSTPPNELQNAVSRFELFTKKYPNNILSIRAEFNIARLYIVKEEFEKGRLYLKEIINKYKKSKAICSEALFMTGNSYELQDKWEQALAQYKKLMQEYATTQRGLSVPIYIAQHYKIKHQPDKMLAAYQEAAAHYKAVAVKFAGSGLAYNADALVAQCYAAIKDWPRTVDAYNAMLEKYEGKANLDGVLLSLAVIYGNQLKDAARAKEILNRLINEYPKSRFIKAANALLEKKE